MTGTGTKDDPWELTTAPGSSQYTMYRDEQGDPRPSCARWGATTLRYRLGAIGDLSAWLRERGEALGLVELTHDARNNRVRAVTAS